MLTITTEFRRGILFVRLRGTLDKETIYKFNKKVIRVIKESGIRNVVFNFSNLKHIDMKGINLIFYSYELCKSNDGRSLMCGNNDKIRKRLKKSRLINYVYEISDELSAIKLMNTR